MKAQHFVAIGLSSASLAVTALGVAIDANPAIYLVAIAFGIFGFAAAAIS